MKDFKTQFTSFYSYKGGVGRTSALINTALLMAIKGERVVVLDFDLEAPGLASYVMEIAEKNKISKKNLENKTGVLEYLYASINTNTVPTLREKSISHDDLGLNILGKFWFVDAGNTSDKDYTRKLNSLNWSEIFEKKHGLALLKNLKKQIIEEFEYPDYVFIDSRTGITDIGGICTKYLSDLVVVLSSLNSQNIQGTSQVISSFNKSEIQTILVASNIPVGLPWGKNQLLSNRLNKFSECFKKKPDLLIYHYPSLSLTEYLPSLFKFESDTLLLNKDPLLISYQNLAHAIENKNPSNFSTVITDKITDIFFLDKKADNDLNKIRKFYSNRESIIDIIEEMTKVHSVLKRNNKIEHLNREFLESIHKILNFDNKFEYDIKSFESIKRMITYEASQFISKFAIENPTKMETFTNWFDVILPAHLPDLIISFMKNESYEFLIKNLKDEESPFIIFSKGYAAEKFNDKYLADKMYSRYVNRIDPKRDNIKHPYTAFTCSFVFDKIGNKEKAYEYAKLCHSLLETDDTENNLFIPTKFIEVNNKTEFLKELEAYENSELI